MVWSPVLGDILLGVVFVDAAVGVTDERITSPVAAPSAPPLIVAPEIKPANSRPTKSAAR